MMDVPKLVGAGVRPPMIEHQAQWTSLKTHHLSGTQDSRLQGVGDKGAVQEQVMRLRIETEAARGSEQHKDTNVAQQHAAPHSVVDRRDAACYQHADPQKILEPLSQYRTTAFNQARK